MHGKDYDLNDAMKCVVTIDNGIDGESVSEGLMEISADSFNVKYKFGGDDCELLYSDGNVTHVRRGSVNLNLKFSRGKRTLGSLCYGGHTGVFPVFTGRMSVNTCESGLEVMLSYVCTGESKKLYIKAEKSA